MVGGVAQPKDLIAIVPETRVVGEPLSKSKPKCQELERLTQEAKLMALGAGRTDRFSQYGATHRQKEADRAMDALIQHLLVGHNGKPCPAGDRPIVKLREA